MKNTELCPKCQVGADAYKLDPKEPMCPYLHYHNGEKCTMFKEMTGGDDK